MRRVTHLRVGLEFIWQSWPFVWKVWYRIRWSGYLSQLGNWSLRQGKTRRDKSSEILWIGNALPLHSSASGKGVLSRFGSLRVRGMPSWGGQRFKKFPCWSKRVNKWERAYKDAARLSVNGILVSLRACWNSSQITKYPSLWKTKKLLKLSKKTSKFWNLLDHCWWKFTSMSGPGCLTKISIYYN